MSDNNLVKGIYLKTPHENAPDWVKRKVSINVDQLIEYLQENRNEAGYVNCDLKEAKSTHWYLELDTWQPDNQRSEQSSSTPNNKPFTAPPFGKFGKKKDEGLFESSGLPEDFEDDIPF